MIRVLFLLLAMFCTGCASLFSRSQNVKVVTNPPGAKIYHEGELLGETPTYIELRRRIRSQIELEFPSGAKEKVDLGTRYRWGDSFGMNMMMIPIPYFVAAGIGIDFWTQAAWNYEPLPVLSKTGPQDQKIETAVRRIAIAPPTSGAYTISKEVGLSLQTSLQKKFPKAKIIDFRQTQAVFERYTWVYDHQTEPPVRENLYKDLGVTHILDSEVVPPEDGKDIEVRAKLIDVFTGESRPMESVFLKREQVPYFDSSIFHKGFHWLLTQAPNNYGLNAVSHQTVIRDGANNYYSEESPEAGPLSFLSGISLRRIEGRDAYRRWKFKFAWVPSINLSHRHLKFTRATNSQLGDTRFSWLSAHLGFGPQLTLHMPVGRLYMELLPSYGLSYVSWRQSSDHEDIRGVWGAQLELGYLFFISERFNFRIFAASQASDKTQWETVLNRATNESIILTESGYSTAGISLAYYFPEASYWGENLFY